MTSNTLDPKVRSHTTHRACGEALQKYGSAALGCCCTGHQCQTDAEQLTWMDKPSTAPLQVEDFENEPNPRAALRAEVRNGFLDMHSALTDYISSVAQSYREAAEALGLEQDNDVAAALSDLAVTAQRVVDKVESQLNKQMMEEQKQ